MSSVTIGGQTFIKTAEGWVDKKTKAKAPEGLTALLDNVAEEESPAGKKKRVRIDTSRPVVKLGKSEYVWDLNSQVWIDKKTKDPVNPAFSKLIEATYQSIEQGVTADDELYDKSKTAKSVANNMGSTGKAAQQKVKKPTGGGQFQRPANIRINSPIVAMIEKLAVIDGYLKQRVANQVLLNTNSINAQREQQIEGADQIATPVLDDKQIQAEVEEENKKSNAGMVAAAVGVGAILAYQFNPVKETINSVADFAKGVFDFTVGIASALNQGLRVLVGTPESRAQSATAEQTSTTQAGPSSTSAASGAAGSEENTPYANPSSGGNGSAGSSSGSATPDEITTPFPGPTATSSSSTRGTSSSSSSSSSSGSTSSSSSSSGSSGSSSSSSGSTGSSSTRSSDATRTSAPPPASVSPAPAAPIPDWLSSAPLGTVWQGGGFMVKKEVNGTYSIRAPGNEWVTGESASNARHYIETARLNASSGSQYNPGGVVAGPDPVDGYINPVEGYEPNSPYGMRNHPVQGGKKFHTGMDFAAPEGTPVRAVKGGTVSKISNNQRPYRGFGNVVIIDHGDGYQTVYAHLSKFACREGDRVQQGQIIGYVGSTGMSTGAHLHFMVQKTGIAVPNAGNTVNPAPLLQKGGVTIPAGMEGYDMESGGAGSSALQSAASAGAALTEGAMEAIGNILRTAIDSGNMTTVGLGMQMADMTTSQSISRAARERNAEIAAARGADEPAIAAADPMNITASSGGSSTIQNLPTGSDLAGVEFYLTRMGFPKIEYAKPISRVA